MSYADLLIHEVTVYNPTSNTTDRYNNPVIADDAGQVVNARVQEFTEPAASSLRPEEHIHDRDTRITRYRVFLPLGITISALSTIEWSGHRHRINGEPAIIDDRTGPHHVECVMERVEG